MTEINDEPTTHESDNDPGDEGEVLAAQIDAEAWRTWVRDLFGEPDSTASDQQHRDRLSAALAMQRKQVLQIKRLANSTLRALHREFVLPNDPGGDE